MKDKLIIFIVGLLVGAIISTGSIYFYTIANNNNGGNEQGMGMQMPNGTPPDMQNNNFGNNGVSTN